MEAEAVVQKVIKATLVLRVLRVHWGLLALQEILKALKVKKELQVLLVDLLGHLVRLDLQE